MERVGIGVIAPSWSLVPEYKKLIPIIEESLSSYGYSLRFGPNCEKVEALKTASVEARVEDLHWAFSDPEIDIVMSFIGGFSQNQMLPLVDWELIAKGAKPFIGHSDATILCNAIFAVTGLSSFYGLNLRNLTQSGQEVSQTTLDNLISVLRAKKLSEQCFYSTEWYNSSESSELLREKSKLCVIQAGTAEGVCLGGNVGTFFLLQGTPWMPKMNQAFILMLEDDDMPGKYSLEEFDRKFESILQVPGASKNIQGLLIGRYQQEARVSLPALKKVIESKRALRDKPVIANLNFGHTSPRAILPIGGNLNISADLKTQEFQIQQGS